MTFNELLYQFLIYTNLFGREKATHVPVYPTGYFLSLETFEAKHTLFNYKSNFGKKMSAFLFIDGLIFRMPIAMQSKTPQ